MLCPSSRSQAPVWTSTRQPSSMALSDYSAHSWELCFSGSSVFIFYISQIPDSRRFARRPLLIITSLFVGLGMALLGTSAFLSREKEDAGEMSGFLDYLPLISVNIVAVSYQLGLGPICWSYAGK